MSPETDFQSIQHRFAGHIRDPDGETVPAGLAAERMAVYVDLFYNNIEGLLAGFFPVLRKVLDDTQWHGIVRDFIRVHRCKTPYFLEIAREFLEYLDRERPVTAQGPPFLRELAHYEWVELALNIAEQEPAPPCEPGFFSDESARIRLSPLAWALQYDYPVHRIGPQRLPAQPPQVPTFLVVYRNREEAVRFLEINGLTFLLLEQLRVTGEAGICATQLVAQVADQVPGLDSAALQAGARETLEQLAGLAVLGSASV